MLLRSMGPAHADEATPPRPEDPTMPPIRRKSIRRRNAEAATADAQQATPDYAGEQTVTSEACIYAAEAHERAMQAWADEAAEATGADHTFCSFLADAHEQAMDGWRDEAQQCPSEDDVLQVEEEDEADEARAAARERAQDDRDALDHE